MDDDDWSKQADEVEALSSIFCDQFTVDDPVSHKYSIVITDGTENSQFQATLQVTFPPDYPSKSPPTYQINAPWLRGAEKNRIASYLDEIYCENIGESLVYLWVEKIREFLTSRSEAAISKPVVEHLSSEKGYSEKNEGHEVEDKEDGDDYDDGDGFDPALHIYKPPLHQYVNDVTEGSDIPLPPIHHGEFVKDRKSIFQGHLAPVTHRKQVDMVMSKLKENRKIAEATHNIIAYRIQCGPNSYITGCVDDGEIHAGSRMLHLLDIIDAKNVLVVVTRWYGGVHLGPDRFKHINNCTRELLEAHGYIRDKTTDKKGPKSHASGQDGQNSATSRGHTAKHGKKGK